MALRTVLRGVARAFLGERTRRGLRFDLTRAGARWRSRFSRPPDASRLHVGCGLRRVEGFLNVDVRGSEWDLDLAAGRLPFRDGAFEAIVCEHVIEHLELESELLPLLTEFVRVLRDGGEAWVSCPDMNLICRSYLADGGVALLEGRRRRFADFSLRGLPAGMMLNELFHQGGEHKNLFDLPLLAHVLQRAGFGAVDRVSEGDLRRRYSTFPWRHDEDCSLYVRARTTPTPVEEDERAH